MRNNNEAAQTRAVSARGVYIALLHLSLLSCLPMMAAAAYLVYRL